MYKRIPLALLILALCALFVPSAALAIADADGDGFDDVTQDLCLGDSAHGETACSGLLLGSNLTAPHNNGTACAGACVFYPTVIPGGTATALVNSVIVRWRIKDGDPAGSEFRLRVVKILPLDTVQGVRTGPVLLANGGTDVLVRSGDIHVPIAAGESIGLQVPAGVNVFTRTNAGATTARHDTDLPDGNIGGLAGSANDEQLFSADIEPDADGDTYGDITQDLCATDATRQTACADVTGPTVNIAITKKKFRVNRKGAVISKAVPAGTAFTTTLSEAADVTYKIYRRLPGRVVKNKCVGQTPNNRVKKKCTRAVLTHTFTKSLPAGVSAVAYSGRYKRNGKTVTLKHGAYELRITAKDAAGNSGTNATEPKFSVVK